MSQGRGHNRPDEKSAAKSVRTVGKPFVTGHDPRRGRGPKKGAPNAGRPPNELRAMLREAAYAIAIPRLARVAAEGTDANAVRAAQVILDRALPTHAVPEGEPGRFVIFAPEPAKTTEEWMQMVRRWQSGPRS